MSRTEKTGVEITVRLHENIIQTHWIAPGSSTACGDSHLYPILFPLPDDASGTIRYSPDTKKDKRPGLMVRRMNGVSSWGLPILNHAKDGEWRLHLAPGMSARVDGHTTSASTDEVLKIPLDSTSRGIVHGLRGWTLAFRVVKQKRFTIHRGELISPFFLQALIYGAVFVTGILWLSWVSHVPQPLMRELPTEVKRLGQLNKAFVKREKEKTKPAPAIKKKRPLLRAALANRKLRFRTQKTREIKKVKMAAFFKQRRTFFHRKSPEEPVDLDGTEKGTNTTPATSAALPASDPVELNIPLAPVAPGPVTTVAPTKPQRPKPYIKVRPARLSFPGIAYPESAKHLGIEGRVKLRLYIDKSGKVVKVDVITKLHPILDRRAQKAAMKARFKPAVDQYGDPISSTVVISITFKLEEEE